MVSAGFCKVMLVPVGTQPGSMESMKSSFLSRRLSPFPALIFVSVQLTGIVNLVGVRIRNDYIVGTVGGIGEIDLVAAGSSSNRNINRIEDAVGHPARIRYLLLLWYFELLPAVEWPHWLWWRTSLPSVPHMRRLDATITKLSE